MKKNPTDSKLQAWLREISPSVKLEKFAKEIKGPVDADAVNETFHIYTDRYRYHIMAREAVNLEDSYLGAQVSCRKPRAGEDQHRGNDLPDGKFTRETWENIKNGIIENELILLDITEATPIDFSKVKMNGTP